MVARWSARGLHAGHPPTTITSEDRAVAIRDTCLAQSVTAWQTSDQNPSAGPTNAHGSDWTMKIPNVTVTGSTQNRVPQEPAQPYVPAGPGIKGAGGSTLTPTPRPYPSPSET